MRALYGDSGKAAVSFSPLFRSSRGKYFGYIGAPVSINISNMSCLNAAWGNDGMVTCQPQVCKEGGRGILQFVRCNTVLGILLPSLLRFHIFHHVAPSLRRMTSLGTKMSK